MQAKVEGLSAENNRYKHHQKRLEDKMATVAGHSCALEDTVGMLQAKVQGLQGALEYAEGVSKQVQPNAQSHAGLSCGNIPMCSNPALNPAPTHHPALNPAPTHHPALWQPPHMRLCDTNSRQGACICRQTAY